MTRTGTVYSLMDIQQQRPFGRDAMRKTTIVLTEEQYFYLQERAVELKRNTPSASMASVIRDLIERDRKKRRPGRKASQ